MRSAKLLIGGLAALAAVAARLGRRDERGAEPEPAPEPGDELAADELAADELAADELDELREELRRELERLAGGDVEASRLD